MKLENFSRGYAHNEGEFGFHAYAFWLFNAKMDIVGRTDRG